MSGKQPIIEWNLGSRAQNVTNEIRSFVVALFVAAHLTKRYVFSGGNQPPAHGGHGGLKGVKVVLVDPARNTFKLTVQPGENNTRREFMVLVDGHTVEHVVNQIKAVTDAAKTRKKSRRKGASSTSAELATPTSSSTPPPPTEAEPQRVQDLFSRFKTDLSPVQQAKLVQLQNVITPAEFAQLQLFLENGWVTHLDSWVRLRLDRQHLAFLPSETEDLVVFLDKLLGLELVNHAGHSRWGVDLEAEQCVELSRELFVLIPHLTDPSVRVVSTVSQLVEPVTVPSLEQKGARRRLASNRNPVWLWIIQPSNFDRFLLALAGLIESQPSKVGKRQVAFNKIVKAVKVLSGLQVVSTKVFTWALIRLVGERHATFTIDTSTGIEVRSHRVGLTDAGWIQVRELRKFQPKPTPELGSVQPTLHLSHEVTGELGQLLVDIRQTERALEDNLIKKAPLEQERVDLKAKLQDLETKLEQNLAEYRVLYAKLEAKKAKKIELEAEEQAKQAREQAIQVELGRLGELPSDILAGVLEQLAAKLRSK